MHSNQLKSVATVAYILIARTFEHTDTYLSEARLGRRPMPTLKVGFPRTGAAYVSGYAIEVKPLTESALWHAFTVVCLIM